MALKNFLSKFPTKYILLKASASTLIDRKFNLIMNKIFRNCVFEKIMEILILFTKNICRYYRQYRVRDLRWIRFGPGPEMYTCLNFVRTLDRLGYIYTQNTTFSNEEIRKTKWWVLVKSVIKATQCSVRFAMTPALTGQK